MKQRQNTKWIKRKPDVNGKKVCLIPPCNNLCEKGGNGRLRNYCNIHTFLDMREYNNWPCLRLKALRRDNFTCVKCGSKGSAPYTNLRGDHILPIALGGEEFDISNVQTLCLKCDKIKTSQDLKDIAVQRRLEKELNQ